MQKLSKLDLEPNEIYNVSFNIKQGNKNIDTLRFFQTQVPKLFNIKPSNFNTFSQINESATSVKSEVTNSGIIPGGPSHAPNQGVKVKSVEWKFNQFPTSREDGVTSYEPEGVEYTFTITFNGAVEFTSYYLSGFKGFLDFLNYRTDYQVVDKNTLRLKLSLADIDPLAETIYSVKRTTTPLYVNIVDAIPVGSTTVYLPEDTKLTNIIAGKSNIYALGAKITYQGVNYGSSVVWDNAPIIDVGKFTTENGRRLIYLTMGKTALSKKEANTQVAIYGTFEGTSFTGDFYKYLKKGGDQTSKAKNATVASANIIWQTSTRYDATKASTNYTFKKSSSISSSLINPNIIEKLIWEDEVRDYIYFIISDTDTGGDNKKYFFGTYGDSLAFPTLATENTSLKGTETFKKGSPPSVTDNPKVISSSLKRFPTSTGKVKYYEASKLQVNNQTVPELLRKVEVQFAIARYTKKDGVWSAYWLPNRNASENEILSQVEVLD